MYKIKGNSVRAIKIVVSSLITFFILMLNSKSGFMVMSIAYIWIIHNMFFVRKKRIESLIILLSIAIAYIGMGYMTNTVEGITVDGVAATVENVTNKSYSISRALYWYTNGEPVGDVKAFIDYALSSGGQDIVKKEGFVPVK